MLNKTIVFSEAEMRLIDYLAKVKSKKSRDAGIYNARKSAMSDLEIEKLGVAGELAVTKAMNLYPNFDVEPKSAARGTDKGDLILPNGLTCDVKATNRLSGRLMVSAKKLQSPADVYALVTGAGAEWIVRGFISAEKLFQPDNLQDLGKGALYVVDQMKLAKPFFTKKS